MQCGVLRLVRELFAVPRRLWLDGNEHADCYLAIWQHLAPVDSCEPILVRKAHDGRFAIDVRADVCARSCASVRVRAYVRVCI